MGTKCLLEVLLAGDSAASEGPISHNSGIVRPAQPNPARPSHRLRGARSLAPRRG